MFASTTDLLGDRAFYFSAVLVLGILSQWLAWRFRIPSILILLICGFALGRVFDPDALIGADLIFPLVSLAVAVILFEGGLSLRFNELKEAGGPVLRLCTLGVLVSWGLTALLGKFIGLGWGVATLLGAVLVVTGPTVVAPLLRIVKPSRKVSSMVKWEGIVVDPIGALLALLVFQTLVASNMEQAAGEIARSLAMTLAVGVGMAVLLAKFLELLLRKHWIPDYLHGVAFLAVAAGAFTASNLIQHESGLLTVTLLGMALANQKTVAVHHVIEFKEHLRVLLISALFIVLAGRVGTAEILALGWRGAAFLIGLILVVRPVSVFLATLGSKTSMAERLFLAFLAPRGIVAAAVTSIFALELIHASEGGLIDAEMAEQARLMVPLTFCVIVGTVAIYGLLAAPLARKLGLASSNPQGVLFVGVRDWVISAAKALQEAGFATLIVDTNYDQLSRARMEGLNTCRTNILSDYAEEQLDLAGLGRLLAVTPNEEVNTLACIEYRQVFGSAEVYQLRRAERRNEGSERVAISEHRRGRALFSSEPTFGDLAGRETAGWQVKTTTLSDEFSEQDFLQRYSGEAIRLFVITAAGKLRIGEPDGREVKVGDTLIALVPVADELPAPSEGAGKD